MTNYGATSPFTAPWLTETQAPYLTGAAPKYPIAEPGPASGILFLRDTIAAYFQENSVPATVPPVGLKYRSFTLNQNQSTNANRVVLIPGEFDGNLALKSRPYGTLSRNTRNSTSGYNPRELLHWERPITFSIWAAPVVGKPEREDLSVGTCEDLLEQVVRAVNSAQALGTSFAASVEWGDVLLTAPPNENSFGTELLVSAVQKGPLFDRTLEVAQANPLVTRGGTTT